MVPTALAFIAGTAALLWVSRHALRNPRAHGFYRFFAWECILGLVLLNFPVWERDPFAPHQIASWALLLVSPALAIQAVRQLKHQGRPDATRSDAELFGFERTSRLVTSGLFRYLRHPMYAALIYLAWGAYLKDAAAPLGIALVSAATLLLLLTALRDEAECRAHFGPAYDAYMKTSKRFVPFVF